MDAALTPLEFVELFPPFVTCAIIGVRNSGKSVLTQQIIKAVQKKKMVDIVIVMSGSAQLNDDYSFLPEGALMNFNDGLLHRIWNKQVADKKEGKEKKLLIVFDDCLTDKNAIRNEIIQKIWVQGRHVSINSFLLSQYPAYITSPIILGNSDFLMTSKLNRQAIERVWESTVGISKKDFINITESIAGVDYTFLVINNYCKSPKPEDYLTYVRGTKEKPKKSKAKSKDKDSDSE